SVAQPPNRPMIQPTPVERPRSTAYKYKPKTKDVRMTTIVVAHTSRRVGQVTRPSSPRTSVRNRRPRTGQFPPSADSFKLSRETTFIAFVPRSRGPSPARSARFWQARRDSNPQLPVLETGALPIELLAFAARSLRSRAELRT